MKATTPTATAKSIARCAILLTAGTIGFLGLFAIPLDEDPCWFEKVIISKAVAVAGFYAYHKLYERWRHTDKWLKKYDEDCQRALETPNLCYIRRKEADK